MAAAHGEAIRSPQAVGQYDRLWQRYGVDSISPALLAYWQEVCAAVDSWPREHWDGSLADTYGYLASFHGPCQTIVPAGPVRVRTTSPLCIVVGQRDSVTPRTLIGKAFQGLGPDVVTSKALTHASAEGLEECLTRVRARRR